MTTRFEPKLQDIILEYMTVHDLLYFANPEHEDPDDLLATMFGGNEFILDILDEYISVNASE